MMSFLDTKLSIFNNKLIHHQLMSQREESNKQALRILESKLSCPICHEFYNTAMMVKECSHNCKFDSDY